ncbi:hypothetical protein BDW74DRAFT_181722 [Aspergillus multicolor]|uniref:uncharacterized protein n=1 Tax=Aspergillus multicolor TaxID=41759 RepID=UPI003CCD93BA
MLPEYSDDYRYCLERRHEHKANLAAFEEGVMILWNEISTWTDKAPGSLRLELIAKSKPDDWTDFDFDNEARWLYREYSLDIGDRNVKLPTLNCIRHLVLGVQGRRIHLRVYENWRKEASASYDLKDAPISPALFTSRKKGEDETGFPCLEFPKITYPIYTYDCRWYWGGNRATYPAPEEFDEMELLKIEYPTEDEGESDNQSDSGCESVTGFASALNTWRDPLSRDRADFLDGNAPEFAWRRRPEPKTFHPLLKSIAKAVLHMTKLRSLIAIAKA